MKNLINIISSLKPSEAKMISEIYRLNQTKIQSKKLRLFNLIHKKKCKSDIEASHQLYAKPPNSAYSHLKTRLKDDLLNYLLILPDCNYGDITAKAEQDCTKLIFQSKVLSSRKVYGEAECLLKKASKLASEYEFPELKFVADNLLIHTLSGGFGFSDKLLTEDIKWIKNQFVSVSKSEMLTSGEVLSFVEHLKEKPKKIFFLKLFKQLKILRKKCSYKEAANLGLKMLHHLNSNPVLDYNGARASLLLEIGRNYYLLRIWVRAREFGKKASKYQGPSKLLKLNCLELFFLASIKSHNLDKANDVVVIANHLMEHMNSIKVRAKWTFYQACLDFSKGKLTETIKDLYAINGINGCWKQLTFHGKLLELMALNEIEDMEWFDYRLEGYRKFVWKYFKARGHWSKRAYGAFKTLASNNYNFDSTIASHIERFKLIDNGRNHQKWKKSSLNVVDLFEWFETKSCHKSNHF